MHEAFFMRLQDDGYIGEELGIFIKGEEKNSVLWERIRENSILRKRKRFIRFSRWGAAAVLLLVICVSLFIKKGEQEVVPVAIQTILPGSHKATLFMENGEEIELSVRMSIEQGIIASNNQLEYGDLVKELASGYYHVLKIPRGGEYRLKLSDGTIVYLNSDSELRYPVNFSATSREVELRGEAFFEVTKSKHRFVVNTERMKLQVYGTTFNVVANGEGLEDEAVLVEGSVGITPRNGEAAQEVMIRPGEKSVVNAAGQVTVKETDVAEYIAKRNGYILFNGKTVGQILQELEMYYGVNFTVGTGMKLSDKEYVVSISRRGSLQEALDILELISEVHFTIEGKEVKMSKD